jgi:hypothetical protein
MYFTELCKTKWVFTELCKRDTANTTPSVNPSKIQSSWQASYPCGALFSLNFAKISGLISQGQFHPYVGCLDVPYGYAFRIKIAPKFPKF